MAKLRECKICGKKYEYCGHCPNKNPLEPWRNLYCSENCRDAFKVMGDFTAKKISANEAKAKLDKYGLCVEKVRNIHKAVVMDIFRLSKQVEEKPVEEVSTEKKVEVEKPVEVVVAEDTEKPVFQKPFKKKQRKPENEIVNED